MRSENSSRRERFIASAAAALLLVGGITTTALGLYPGPPATSSTASPATSSPATSATPSQIPAPATVAAAGAPAQAPVPAVLPVRVDVPSIGVSSSLLDLGKDANGEVQTPPGEPRSPAGWYKNSPVPGQTGSSVILGHVNSTAGPVGVFYRLHELTAGQEIDVTRNDHTTAVFTVDIVKTYHKSAFPTIEVYQNADRPEVRLITCGGYDPATREYLDNTVVYAHLTATKPA